MSGHEATNLGQHSSFDDNGLGVCVHGPNCQRAWRYAVREVVGLFSSTIALSTAVERLGLAGFDRASLYVLGLESAPGESAAALADDKMAQRSAFSQMRELFCKILTDSVTEIFRYMVRATDGDAGFLKKIVFDGDNWRVNTMVVELRSLPLFDSAQFDEAPHHARYDAMALRDYVSAHGL